jgi:hypothetical protein
VRALWPVLAAMLAGAPACGRFGFDPPSSDAAGGSADAPRPIDAPPDVPAACTHRFCDDLEDPAFAAWGGTDSDLGATVVRDPARGFRGGSLKAFSPNGSSLASLYTDTFLGVTSPDHWVRVMLYVASGPALDVEPVHFTDPLRNQQIVFALYDTDIDIHSHFIASNFNETLAQPPPRDQWVCYELHVRFAVAGLVELYRDGTRILSRAIDTSFTAGMPLSRVLVGVASKPTNLAATVWADDVIADTVQIGCP